MFLKEVYLTFSEQVGDTEFLFLPGDHSEAGGTEFISSELVDMADIAGIMIPPGMKLSIHSPRRGMLTEFLLQSPRVDDLVIARRMDWSPGSKTVLCFCATSSSPRRQLSWYLALCKSKPARTSEGHLPSWTCVCEYGFGNIGRWGELRKVWRRKRVIQQERVLSSPPKAVAVARSRSLSDATTMNL